MYQDMLKATNYVLNMYLHENVMNQQKNLLQATPLKDSHDNSKVEHFVSADDTVKFFTVTWVWKINQAGLRVTFISSHTAWVRV